MYRSGLFVSAINPLIIKNYQNDIIARDVKTDVADALKIVWFALGKSDILPQYNSLIRFAIIAKLVSAIPVVQLDQNCN